MDNHFLPRFYLSRWATDKQVWEYKKRNNGKMEGQTRSPKATGYLPDLYKNKTKDSQEAHAFELKFLQQHDDLAGKALIKLETSGKPTDKEMCGWISFLMAMHLRHPDDIGALRSAYTKRWLKELGEMQNQYREIRGSEDPEHVCEYIERQEPGKMEDYMFSLLQKLMQHEHLGQLILEFQHTITSLNSDMTLITGDRPILMTPTLSEDDAYLIIPVGPKKLYVAGKTKTTIARILDKNANHLVGIINDQVCRHCNIAAYSTQPGLEEYIQERFGSRVYDSWFTRLARNF